MLESVPKKVAFEKVTVLGTDGLTGVGVYCSRHHHRSRSTLDAIDKDWYLLLWSQKLNLRDDKKDAISVIQILTRFKYFNDMMF